jgi:circadian clock protein KaiC
MSKNGVRLLPVYIGSGTVLTGAARLAQEAKEKAESLSRQQTTKEQRRVLAGKRKALDAQIEALRSEFAQEEARVALLTDQEEEREREMSRGMLEMGDFRAGARQAKSGGTNGKVGVEHGS